jgi:hypothetical protein
MSARRFLVGALLAATGAGAEKSEARAGENAAPAAPVMTLEPVEVAADARWLATTDAAGRVQFRPARPGEPVRFAKTGSELGPGETAATGHKARVELLGGPDGERWRLGQRTVFQSKTGGGRLLAGTALLVVPDGDRRTVETFGSFARLHEGTWILQAVENEGLKVICLDGPALLESEGLDEAGTTVAINVRLKAGELIFIRPEGRGFGPLVTIYLEELLTTSRLVQGFAEPLPRMTRLVNQAVAQREHLKGLSSALVAGAKSRDGFDVVLPRAEGERASRE